jgi:hypothetical protein
MFTKDLHRVTRGVRSWSSDLIHTREYDDVPTGYGIAPTHLRPAWKTWRQRDTEGLDGELTPPFQLVA